ncbi:MAG: enoyl-CoA hydratase/isomerase family protein [Anaeromyxobacter sp.]|nr:enoyl-CoA hydratase/isomerase family protein [Anaeromyxobacter sp.]MBL0275682.1 enoyl-CoA hydratase/isomerase family protein [Anaeromyxobacter sp.]
MTPQRLRSEERGAVRVLTIDNPQKRNALDFRALDELLAACQPAALAGVRCLVLRGAGLEAFSSGFDLAELGQVNGRGERPDEAVERAADALAAVACPTVAFLNGPAYGGGCELAATCDLRVARQGIALGLPPAKLGVVYPEGGLRRFLQLVGGARTRELFFLGKPVDAVTAQAWGLVNRLVPAEGAEDAALALAEEIAGNAPLAVQGMKRILRLLEAAHERGLSAAERDEIADLRRRAFESQDILEGRKAFAERRPPAFQGR